MSTVNSWAANTGETSMALGRESKVLSVREEQITRRERELNEREAALRERERRMDLYPANWPRCKPIIYHSIRDDIPPDAQSMVKRVYFAWYCKHYRNVTGFGLCTTVCRGIRLVVSHD